MEPADNCRRAASEAVADVEPPQLHDLVETILEEASMVPVSLPSRVRCSPPQGRRTNRANTP